MGLVPSEACKEKSVPCLFPLLVVGIRWHSLACRCITSISALCSRGFLHISSFYKTTSHIGLGLNELILAWSTLRKHYLRCWGVGFQQVNSTSEEDTIQPIITSYKNKHHLNVEVRERWKQRLAFFWEEEGPKPFPVHSHFSFPLLLITARPQTSGEHGQTWLIIRMSSRGHTLIHNQPVLSSPSVTGLHTCAFSSRLSVPASRTWVHLPTSPEDKASALIQHQVGSERLAGNTESPCLIPQSL